MTKEQILQVCADYIQYLDGYEMKKNSNAIGSYDRICHCKWMLNEIPHYIEINKIEKVMRWLGFIQGVLWSNDIFSIDDMKNDNR